MIFNFFSPPPKNFNKIHCWLLNSSSMTWTGFSQYDSIALEIENIKPGNYVYIERKTVDNKWTDFFAHSFASGCCILLLCFSLVIAIVFVVIDCDTRKKRVYKKISKWQNRMNSQWYWASKWQEQKKSEQQNQSPRQTTIELSNGRQLYVPSI